MTDPKTSPSKQRLLDAATEMFATRGVDGVSMRHIAAALGIRAPSIYSHVPSKEALINACITPYLERIHDQVVGSGSLAGFVSAYMGVLRDGNLKRARIVHLDPILRAAALNVGVTAVLAKELTINGVRQELAKPTLAYLLAAPLDPVQHDLIYRGVLGIQRLPLPQ
jgi:AcrR family transcriptional regulator